MDSTELTETLASTNKLRKLFISYSHKDEDLVQKFINHISPLKNNGYINEWYDRKIETGEQFQKDIDANLDDADIICLMISDNFLSSKACIKEKDSALKLRNRKGIRLILIILSNCAWDMHNELNEILAAPTDGKPITSHPDQNDGWLDVIRKIKTVCDSIKNIQNLKISDQFQSFLKSADILTKSHGEKEVLHLDDIYVCPKLNKYDAQELSQRFDSSNIKDDLLEEGKIIVEGENQSGKTTFCKKLFQYYRELNLIPVYIADENKFLGNPIKKIENAFEEQYQDVKYEICDTKRIVPIVDNFHFAKHPENYIEQYQEFTHQVLIVDDIFGLNIKNQNLIKEYTKFQIRQFTALERNELIKKWIQIKEDSKIEINSNHLLQSLDEKTELIERSLGIIFGKGIMPSYPFFVLSILAAQDMQNPLNQEISSQGYCYQALIYLYLRKEGVKNEQIDIYSNFLTELAYWIYKNDGNGLSNTNFQDYIQYYISNFNLPIPIEEMIGKLRNVNICAYNSLNQYKFCYTYIYYFFVAKYIAEHIETEKKLINKIIENLHKDENAYITIFIAHHSKSNYLLDELQLNAEILFENFNPATLDSDELSFFDRHEDKIIQAVLPAYNHNVNAERQKQLVEKSELEDEQRDNHNTSEEDEDDSSELSKNLRLSIKTVEVIGIVMKNRSGSLGLKRLENIFEQGLKVHLRILSSFIELIKNEEAENEIVEFIKERVNLQIEQVKSENKNRNLSIDRLEKFARSIFWNINFGVRSEERRVG